MNKKKDNKVSAISGPSLRRLPLYHSFLLTLKIEEKKYISAPDIAKELHIHPTQIIKDLSFIKAKGKTKVGYEIVTLIKILEEFLGYHILRKAFIVGIGNLGKALIKHHNFHDEGMDIIAGFDNDIEKLKININNLELFHINEFNERIKKTPIDIGIIVVPPAQAQKIADIMIKNKVKLSND